ncbi:MAG TPA: ATP-dependent DNA ligase [Longimicrobiales bacterium]
MKLPIPSDYAPMEAEIAAELPLGDAWTYEPKWDGFRCLAFRDGDHVDLRSKAGKPLGRYFPDIVAAVGAVEAERFVLDGEIVIPVGGDLSFDELLMRIHPAESRVLKLAAEHPGLYVVFDLLVDGRGHDLTGLPLAERRAALEAFAEEYLDTEEGTIRLSPETDDPAEAGAWLRGGRQGLDGVVAKRRDLAYMSGERAMVKVKRMRTADCVVGGFRWAKDGKQVGSLLLGLHGDDGLLHHVGFTGSMPAPVRAEATKRLKALREPPGFSGRAPGGPSRWRKEGSGDWEPVRPELVVEVQYDHFSGGRFRHGTRFLRWRPDKDPRSCTLKQVGKEAGRAAGML